MGAGSEPASEMVLHELDHEGIDTSHVVQQKELRVSFSTVLLSLTGERTILNYSKSSRDKRH